MELIRFDSKDLANVLATMDDSKIDDLAFGAIKLDANGTILRYNAAESDITGRKIADVVGKNFFTEVAPCTHRPEFYGRFAKGVKAGQLDDLFEYVFDHQMKPTKVKVHMRKAVMDESYWVFVKRL